MLEQENKVQTAKSSRLFKFALITSLILGVILIVGFSMSLDSFRKPIMDELSKATGLSIEIKSLKLSFSHGLGLRGTGLKVNSKDGSRQIFSAEDLFLDAELEPLLNRQLKIRKITLVEPAMSVVLGSKVDSTALSESPQAGKTPDHETPRQPDQMKNAVPEPEDDLMEPIRKVLEWKDLSLRAVEIKDAALTLVRPKTDSLPAKKIPVTANARFDLSRPNPDQVTIDGKLSQVDIGGLNFTGTLKTRDLLANHIPVNIDLESTSLPITRINTLIETFAGPEAIPVKMVSGQIEKIFIRLEGLVDPNHDPLKEVVIKSGIKISNLQIPIPDNEKPENIVLPHLDGKGVWQKGTLNYKFNGTLWDGTIQSNLIVNLPEALQGSFTGTFNSETRLKEMNLASVEFDLPDKWTHITGTVDGVIKAQGPIGQVSSNIRTNGKLNINTLSLGSETPTTAKLATLTIRQKSPQRTLARVQIKDALFNNVTIKTVAANLKLSPDKFSLTNGRMVPANGVILFSGNYRPKPNTYIIRLNGDKLRVEDFMKEQMEGSGLFKGMFQGNLNTAQKVQQKGEAVLFSHVASDLSGKLSVQLKDGGITTIPAIDGLLTLLNPTSVITAQKKGINYDTLGGDFKIWNGKTVTDNFALKGPQMNLEALAAANLATGKLDGEIKVMPIQLVDSIVKAIPLLGNILTGGGKSGLVESYFRLGGTLEEPELVLQEGKTLFGKPVSILEELVKTPGNIAENLTSE